MSHYYCFDENISTYLVELLIHLKVSGDPRMRKTHAAIFSQHNMQTLFMPDKSVQWTLWKQCAWTFTYWPTVEDNVNREKALKQARITDNGKLVPL